MNTKFQQMYELVASIVKHSEAVTINQTALEARYPELQSVLRTYQSRSITIDHSLNAIEKQLLFFLMTGSINYCFWQGNSFHRPVPGGATVIWGDAHTAVQMHNNARDAIYAYRTAINKLPLPLSESRQAYLGELELLLPDKITGYCQALLDNVDLTELAAQIVQDFPQSFGQDILFKRISLALELMHEETLLGTNVAALPVPADYQVPKVLRAWGILEYSEELNILVDQASELPRNGTFELEIRAATIEVGTRIYQSIKVPPHVADRHIWGLRKQFSTPHHLTITTDY